jgi:hypothetical protein
MSFRESIHRTSAPEGTLEGRPNEKHGTTNRPRLLVLFLLMCALCWRSDRAFSLSAGSEPAKARDGAHDFDFGTGVWHTHIRRVLDPFSASSDVIELSGTVTTRPIWGGRARLEEIEADGPKGHWEGLSLFLYNPQSHQWSQSFLNSKTAVLSGSLVGEFHDGRAELYQHDTFHDKSIFVRAVWSEITPNSHRYTESFSNDGGKTWVTSFDAHKTREKDLPPSDMAAGAEPMSAGADGHAFDFDLGTWHTKSSRLMHPLTGSTTWTDLEGQTVVHRVWGGRANLAEFKGDGPGGHIELLALRWFNPNTHEWNLDFATPDVGTLGEQPGVGQCKDGRCEFYDQEEVNGRQIWIRFSIWKISDDSAQSEQAFSDDGGKTWEVNWINKYTRAN